MRAECVVSGDESELPLYYVIAMLKLGCVLLLHALTFAFRLLFKARAYKKFADRAFVIQSFLFVITFVAWQPLS